MQGSLEIEVLWVHSREHEVVRNGLLYVAWVENTPDVKLV
jgi:hypothetical protein